MTPPRPDLVSKAIAPDYGLGPHTASLGLTFYRAGAFPSPYRAGTFVGQHGSWNRQPLNSYRVVFIPFANGRPQMPAQPFLTGFLDVDNNIQGPVGVALDARGAPLVADDMGGGVWRVAATGSGRRRPSACEHDARQKCPIHRGARLRSFRPGRALARPSGSPV